MTISNHPSASLIRLENPILTADSLKLYLGYRFQQHFLERLEC